MLLPNAFTFEPHIIDFVNVFDKVIISPCACFSCQLGLWKQRSSISLLFNDDWPVSVFLPNFISDTSWKLYEKQDCETTNVYNSIVTNRKLLQ